MFNLSTKLLMAAIVGHANAIQIQFEADTAKPKAKCPFGFVSSSPEVEPVHASTKQQIPIDGEDDLDDGSTEVVGDTGECREVHGNTHMYITDLFNMEGAVEVSEPLTEADYKHVARYILDAYEAVPDVIEPNNNARGNFVGCLLRVAGHDFMDFRSGVEHQGGSDGCINLLEPDNLGIESCLDRFRIIPVFDKVKDRISLPDFFVIAAEVAASRAATSHNPEDFFAEGTLARKFMTGFKYGRRTVRECAWNTGRMPDPEHGCYGDDSIGQDGLK